MPHALSAAHQSALRLVARGEIRTRTATKPHEMDIFYRKSDGVTTEVQQKHYAFLKREGYIITGKKSLDGWHITLSGKGERNIGW